MALTKQSQAASVDMKLVGLWGLQHQAGIITTEELENNMANFTRVYFTPWVSETKNIV